jgi:acetylornithine aminotransferase
MQQIASIPQIRKVKGKGLMLGVEFDFEVGDLRKKLINEKHIFTGGSNNKNLLRILPPLSITKTEIAQFISALKDVLDS